MIHHFVYHGNQFKHVTVKMLMEKMRDISLWKPHCAKVNFSSGRAWIQIPSGNAVGDYCMKWIG